MIILIGLTKLKPDKKSLCGFCVWFYALKERKEM